MSAVASAAFVFGYHAEHERGLWVSPSHDRNTHYRYGQLMAADVRAGDLKRLASDFDKGSIVWPPLHGLLLAVALLASGGAATMAVVPSLCGWAGGAVFAYLAGNRAVQGYGPLAGLVAAAFTLASPIFRDLGLDCMMEGLGGGLTFAVLHAYLRWEQTRTRGSAVWLGLVLTCLFFEKYNYWLLTVLACGLTHLLAHRAEWWDMLKRAVAGVPWKRWLLAQLWHPLTYLLLLSAGLTLAVAVTGGFDLTVGSLTVPFRFLSTLVTVTYAIFLLRLTLWWWTGARHAVRVLVGDHRQPLLYWHLGPILVWFLLPLRITKFVWFLSPANAPTEHPSLGTSINFYWEAFATEFAPGPLFTGLVAALAVASAVGLFARGSFRPAGWVVPVYAVITVALTVKHPNQYPRYFFTAAAGLWLTAGVGAAVLVALFARGHRFAGLGVAAAVLLAVGWAVGPHLLTREPTFNRARTDGSVSLRDLSDPALARTAGDARVAVFTSHGGKFWVEGVWLEAGRKPGDLHVDYREAGPFGPLSPELFARWCEVTTCDAVVFIDLTRGGPHDEPIAPGEGHAELRELLPTQAVFAPADVIDRPGRGTVSVWRRKPPGGTP